MKENKVRWGILGCGKIARKFAEDLSLSSSGYLVSCASRSLSRAEDFASIYSVEKAFHDYPSLVSDPDVDVIYVATPHSMHYENTLLCLENGKHVLVEKPAAVYAGQFEIMSKLASHRGCLLMEAMWTAFLPVIATVKEWTDKGKIGQIRHMDADFGFTSHFDPESRLYDPNLAGGSLLDIGIYPLFMAIHLLGKPQKIQSAVSHAKSGVDDECTVLLSYEGGATASTYSSLKVHSDTKCEIYGTKGKITIPGRFHEQDHFFITNENGESTRVDCGKTGRGYFHEAEHVNNLILNNLTESNIMPHRLTKTLLEVMDEVRKQNSIRYPFEKEE